MGTTQAALRAALRQDLRDEDAAAYLWTDGVLNRHIQHALQDVQQLVPAFGSLSKVMTNPASARIDLTTDVAAVTFLWIDAIEHPLDRSPPVFLPFREEAGPKVYLLSDEIPAPGQELKIWYAKAYAVADGSGDMPIDLDRIVLTGALAYALRDQAIDATDKLGPRDAPRRYADGYVGARRLYEGQLETLRRRASAPRWMPSWSLPRG